MRTSERQPCEVTATNRTELSVVCELSSSSLSMSLVFLGKGALFFFRSLIHSLVRLFVNFSFTEPFVIDGRVQFEITLLRRINSFSWLLPFRLYRSIKFYKYEKQPTHSVIRIHIRTLCDGQIFVFSCIDSTLSSQAESKSLNQSSHKLCKSQHKLAKSATIRLLTCATATSQQQQQQLQKLLQKGSTMIEKLQWNKTNTTRLFGQGFKCSFESCTMHTL